ncbi:MAG TPA: LLM class flavin-dependent oxidoreductase [Acidimicrobiales bacterium]|nr:LLM class flavin-dependent oxidoreductase [Acidimicrobiales bacterium]
MFLPIGNNGWILSETSPQYKPSFELNRQITQRAEDLGFGFVLSMAKFRGYGGRTEHWNHCLESLTLMAGLAAVTERIKLYASVSPITLNPAIVARYAATIDDISDGRFGINIVAGWNRSEYEQMGMWPGDAHYASRYDFASEYVEIMKALWRDGNVTHHSEFFDLDDCMCLPMPKHHIDIVGAGSSPRGKRFVAEHADFHFGGGSSPEKVEASNRVLLAEAAKTGRTVGSYPAVMVVIADTDDEAMEKVAHYNDGADADAIDFMLGQYGLDTATDGSSADVVRNHQRARSAFYGGGSPIAGSPETVARRLEQIGNVDGVAGIMLIFDDFLGGLERFGSQVMPLLLDSAPVAVA